MNGANGAGIFWTIAAAILVAWIACLMMARR